MTPSLNYPYNCLLCQRKCSARLEFEHSNPQDLNIKSCMGLNCEAIYPTNILRAAMFFDPLAKCPSCLHLFLPKSGVFLLRHSELMMQSPTTWEIWAKGQRTSKDKESDPKQIEVIHDSDMTQIENHQKNVSGKWATSF